MHVKNEYREGERYATLEQLQLAITLEESNSKLMEESHSSSTTSVNCNCCCILPCLSLELCTHHQSKAKAKSKENDTFPIHPAILEAAEVDEKRRFDAVRKIGECLDNGVDVNIRDERGAAALVYVKILLRHGHFLLACQIAKLLLDGGADVDVEDDDHQTLLSHSVASLDAACDLTRLLLNYGASVWHATDHATDFNLPHRGESPFGTFLQAVVRCRCVDEALETTALLGRIMGARPEAMRRLVLRSMISHGRHVRVLGPVFLRIKSLLSPYWRQPQRLRYHAWSTIRKTMRPSNLVQELQQLGLPPALNRFINLEE